MSYGGKQTKKGESFKTFSFRTQSRNITAYNKGKEKKRNN